MNAVVREWVAKAAGDFATARRELRVRKNPNFDAVCFHAQQCVEKLMKALAIDQGASPPKTHDLAYLSQFLSRSCPPWSWPVEELRFLSRAAVIFRYPGESSDRLDAADALRLAGRMRGMLMKLLKSRR